MPRITSYAPNFIVILVIVGSLSAPVPSVDGAVAVGRVLCRARNNAVAAGEEGAPSQRPRPHLTRPRLSRPSYPRRTCYPRLHATPAHAFLAHARRLRPPVPTTPTLVLHCAAHVEET